WLRETAMPHTPDYTDEILDQTARIRQRPRWTFIRRWLPLPELGWTAAAGRRVALTGLLLLVLALILAAVAVFVGGRRTALPAPFGNAGNGLVATSAGGDIVLLDPATGATRPIVKGDSVDEHPRWSRDGTHLAFLRQTDRGQAVVIADANGRIQSISDSFTYLDSDSLAWSPDGRHVAFAGDSTRGTGIQLLDAETGAARALGVWYGGLEGYWRPPDGRQLLFRSGNPDLGLALVSIEDKSVVRVPIGDPAPTAVRPLGWTPDGRRVLYQDDDAPPFQTVVVDVETGAQIHLDVAFGHVSNDGTRVAGVKPNGDLGGQLCVVAITGGTCDVVEGTDFVQGPHGASVSWAPDDRWIALLGESLWLVDPTGAVPPRAVAGNGPGSWQRIAP
ncbi:MAG TPA: hypothetical protein VK194_09160, partial [Candidatus Deferrimicrobium sp.]|nr:hypothetical protein [Candidatus Deferrimicrobium sp.]